MPVERKSKCEYGNLARERARWCITNTDERILLRTHANIYSRSGSRCCRPGTLNSRFGRGVKPRRHFRPLPRVRAAHFPGEYTWNGTKDALIVIAFPLCRLRRTAVSSEPLSLRSSCWLLELFRTPTEPKRPVGRGDRHASAAAFLRSQAASQLLVAPKCALVLRTDRWIWICCSRCSALQPKLKRPKILSVREAGLAGK